MVHLKRHFKDGILGVQMPPIRKFFSQCVRIMILNLHAQLSPNRISLEGGGGIHGRGIFT